MRDSVPSGSYSSVCNVLRQWQSRSSLLIESTDSMIIIIKIIIIIIIILVIHYSYSTVKMFNSENIQVLWYAFPVT